MAQTPELDRLSRHLDEVQQLLSRQRLIGSMVNRQQMPRRDLMENLADRENLGQLARLLAGLDVADVVGILEALAPEDRLIAWEQVAEARCDAVLMLLTDTVREDLVNTPRSHGDKSVINAFELHNGRLRHVKVANRNELANTRPIWVDLVAPSPEVRFWVGAHFGVELPDPASLTDLEASARFYVEEKGDEAAGATDAAADAAADAAEIHLHSDFLLDAEDKARNVAVAFILHQDILFSVRSEELPVFRLQRLRARAQPGYVTEGKDVLLDLYAADAEYSADALEDVYADLESVGRKVLNPRITDEEAAMILAEIARGEDLNGRIRRNVLDTRRAVSFLMRGKFLAAQQQEDARQILRDIESLDGHTGFLFGKINFLMDATVGFININQNQRVSKLTTISVIFMPINILAGIGGMSEFSAMATALNISVPSAYAGFVVASGLVGWATYQVLHLFEARRAKRQMQEEREARG